MKSVKLIIYGLIVLSFLTSLAAYPAMPELMASHWDAAGNVNGYLPRFWGVFLAPIISLALLLLFILIPRIDPLKSNIEKFRQYFDRFIAVLLAFLYYIYLLTLAWSWGYRYNMIQLMAPAMAALFYYVGVLVGRAEPNWFIGIRTPWTLSSPSVWKKTHGLGGKLYKATAAPCLLAALLPAYAIYLILIPIIVVSLYLLVYSYLEFKKEKRSFS